MYAHAMSVIEKVSGGTMTRDSGIRLLVGAGCSLSDARRLLPADNWHPLVSSRPYQMLHELEPHGPECIHPRELLDWCAKRFDADHLRLTASTT